jgi:selenocysteine lyase/cysteine desulfurase
VLDEHMPKCLRLIVQKRRARTQLARKPGLDAGAAVASLARREIHVSARNGVIRVAPHVYNDAADIERLLEELAAFG